MINTQAKIQTDPLYTVENLLDRLPHYNPQVATLNPNIIRALVRNYLRWIQKQE